MIEIIPNWHPIFVHFIVSLFTTSVIFYILTYVSFRLKIYLTIGSEFEIVARWCLWIAGIIIIPTVWAGWLAYYTVQHDSISHIAMTTHRNWAFTTAGTMLLVVLWSAWRAYKHKVITFTFIIALLIVQGLLTTTAWRGAELVFRYGLGVMSLPQPEGTSSSQDTQMKKNMSISPKEIQNHQHNHTH